MRSFFYLFLGLLIYPLSLSASDTGAIDPEVFDDLPIKGTEVNKITNLFWNAKSIQDKVKKNLPGSDRSDFNRSSCAVQTVTKTECSADTCELNDDVNKMAQFAYVLSLKCSSGNYQVSIGSKEENRLTNQLTVTRPEQLVQMAEDNNPFDLDSTM